MADHTREFPHVKPNVGIVEVRDMDQCDACSKDGSQFTFHYTQVPQIAEVYAITSLKASRPHRLLFCRRCAVQLAITILEAEVG